MPFAQLQAIEADNQRLLGANERLNATIARVAERRDELHAENVTLTDEVASLLARVERLQAEIDRLRAALATRSVTVEILNDRIHGAGTSLSA